MWKKAGWLKAVLSSHQIVVGFIGWVGDHFGLAAWRLQHPTIFSLNFRWIGFIWTIEKIHRAKHTSLVNILNIQHILQKSDLSCPKRHIKSNATHLFPVFFNCWGASLSDSEELSRYRIVGRFAAGNCDRRLNFVSFFSDMFSWLRTSSGSA